MAKGREYPNFHDDMIMRRGLPKDVMGLLHDNCYYTKAREGRGAIWNYMARAQRILKRESAPPPPTAPNALYYCDKCDGCGWVEGGKALKTDCKACEGTGMRGRR